MRPSFDDLRQQLQYKQYAAMPGTGPEGMTCKQCAWLRHTGHAKGYPKCGRTKYTRGDATTIKTRTPACKHFELAKV